MDYRNLMKTACTTLNYYKNAQEIFLQRMKNKLPINLSNGLKWYADPSDSGDSKTPSGTGRDSSGNLGKFNTAQEDSYFFQKQKEQLRKLKERFSRKKENPDDIKQKPDD